LWRDECAVLQLAEMPKIGEIFANFQRESFPVVFPLTVRAYAAIFGTSDAAFRAFGAVVGVLLLLVCWINSRLLTNSPPLMSLALLGLNATFLIWGTSVRGYGIGSVLILLAFGSLTKMLTAPTISRIIAAGLACVASVQFLLFNSVLLMAIGIAVITVCLIRRKGRPAIAIASIGAGCLVSILPYVWPFWNESRSTVVFQGPVDLGWFWDQLSLAFGDPVHVMVGLWVGSFAVVIFAAAGRLYVTWSNKPLPEWDLLLFGSITSIASIVAYFVFLKAVSYRTREWYYLALLAILAGGIDLVAANLSSIRWVRVARLTFVIATLIGMPFADWPKITERQTNLDFVARNLEEVAQPRDLIVGNPWFFGITLNWYYHGATPWVTLPTMNDHTVHRFDLVKAKMLSSAPLDDLLDMIGGTLRAGNRVWFVGGVRLLPPDRVAVVLPPAPNSEFGWSCDAYAESWSQQLGIFLREHALTEEFVRVPTDGPVNELENVPLLLVRGWRE